MISSEKTKEKQNTKDKQREVQKINPKRYKSRKTRETAVRDGGLSLLIRGRQ